MNSRQRIDARQYVFARPGNNFRNNSERELISVTGRSAIVGLEHQPARGGGESVPLIPIGFEVIAIGILWATVDEHKHRQVFRFKLSRRIHQHAFHRRAVVGRPAIGLRLRKIAFRKLLVE